MTGMDNALLQLALMLRGNASPGSGFDSGGSRPFAPNFSPNPVMSPTLNSWANMPAPHRGVPGSHLPITPAQEIFLGPLNPAWEIPNWEIPNLPEWAIPKPEFFPLPDTGPLGPDIFPPLPYNPPLQIPDAHGEDTKLPPITIPQWPHNPPFEVPDESVGDQIQKLTPDRPVTEIPDDPECEEEWSDALERCGREFLRLRKRRTGEHVYFNQERCVKGYVSQRCGGNGVDPKPQIRPYKPQA